MKNYPVGKTKYSYKQEGHVLALYGSQFSLELNIAPAGDNFIEQ